ncbi:ankyrin repeat domain-containing protein [Spirochaetia bacterium 38H-sp]|uniref:Ankyrin repeat domain-containing protein n=1 Tax=Rarispira pelagica TaxID=3141764 RepID=A0ABU9UB47_9SPIR
MRLAVFFHPGDDEFAKKVLKAIIDIGISANAYRIHPWWKDDAAERLISVLNASTHILLIIPRTVGQHTDELSWLYFLAGFCSAKAKYVYYLADSSSLTVPSFFSGIERIPSIQYLKNAILRGRDDWISEQNMKKARDVLEKLNIPVSNVGFVECVKQENIQALKQFIILGFSPDSCDKNGIPALSHAVRVRSLDVVDFLLSHGADVNKIAPDRNNTPLMDAAGDGNLEIVNRLLQESPNLDIQSKNGQTALILAIGQGALDVANRLIDAGADIRLVDALGMTALKYAELFRYPDLVDKLKEKMADNG